MITENGWPSCGPNDLDRSPIPGTDVVLPLQKGQPSIILKAFAADLNWYVESVYNSRGGADEGGWTGTNSVPTSNHLGGTAFDYNWFDHPMGVALAGWNGSDIRPNQTQEPFVRDLLRYYTMGGLQLVWWANDWDSPKDSMHFQMGYRTFGDNRTQKFIDGFIDLSTGFSHFRDDHGLPMADTANILREAMGDTDGVNYLQFSNAVAQCLAECECTTVPRIAMWVSQIGTESAGLKYMEEIASGAEYEGRTDLGNTQPGDGKRYKGRGPIQVTGRSNYRLCSQWAFARGLVPSLTYFEDNPTELASPTYGFVGVTWYWLTHKRKDDQDGIPKLMNQYADERDLEGGTKCVNGGLHGLPDRQDRYNRAMAMGDRLLNLLTGDDDPLSDPDVVAKINQIHGALFNKVPSQSRYATKGEGARWQLHELVKNDDGMVHESYVERLAILGDPTNVALVARNALRTGEDTDSLAQSVFERIDDRFLTEDQLHLKNTLIVARFGSSSGA